MTKHMVSKVKVLYSVYAITHTITLNWQISNV